MTPIESTHRVRESRDMPNDAKLGLVIGVGLVITVAVVFFRKDQVDLPSSAAGASGGIGSAGLSPTVSTGGARGSFEARSPSRGQRAAASDYRHTVQEGETLFSLAHRYYGDKDRFIEIYQVNRETLRSPDALTPGMTLTIPNVPSAPPGSKAASDP
jgi:nucleoid-associated protein YgaU